MSSQRSTVICPEPGGRAVRRTQSGRTKNSDPLQPDLMGSAVIRAEMARQKIRIQDLPFSPQTVAKLRKGDTRIDFRTLIEIGAFMGLRPQIVWERIPEIEKASIEEGSDLAGLVKESMRRIAALEGRVKVLERKGKP